MMSVTSYPEWITTCCFPSPILGAFMSPLKLVTNTKIWQVTGCFLHTKRSFPVQWEIGGKVYFVHDFHTEGGATIDLTWHILPESLKKTFVSILLRFNLRLTRLQMFSHAIIHYHHHSSLGSRTLVVGRRPQRAVSKLACLVLSSARSCCSRICPGRLSTSCRRFLSYYGLHEHDVIYNPVKSVCIVFKPDRFSLKCPLVHLGNTAVAYS